MIKDIVINLARDASRDRRAILQSQSRKSVALPVPC